MKGIFLTNYKVKGIKSLKDEVELSFYKETITSPMLTKEYNIKGIYGMNGSGKSAIINSVQILKELILNPDYLNNSLVQKKLEEIINKSSCQLSIEVEFVVYLTSLNKYKYQIELAKDNKKNKYVITHEELHKKKVPSRKDFDKVFETNTGSLVNCMNQNDSFINLLSHKTMNLLTTASLPSLFIHQVFEQLDDSNTMNEISLSILALFLFGNKLQIYMEEPDIHTEYLLEESFNIESLFDMNSAVLNKLAKELTTLSTNQFDYLNPKGNKVKKDKLSKYLATIESLQEFMKIFKYDLIAIDVDKKETEDFYICRPIFVYKDYSVNAEFESTGVKKLIKLYLYLRTMVNGSIVFIDELDSNLHDVYLCALLEYLMAYGEGQLCFTTHNVAPMDVLKRNKKSIDFLSTNNKIYPWIKNGNYSPSNLYHSGMIEGSPFNINYFDFLGILDDFEEY